MALDALQQELLRNSPTFRSQVSAAFTSVALARWKMANITVLSVDAAEMTGTATTEMMVARVIAKTERTFLEKSLSTQGVDIVGNQQPTTLSFSQSQDAAREGVTKMINQLLGDPATTWTWTVQEWIENSGTAVVEIAARLNDMIASMSAIPTSMPAAMPSSIPQNAPSA